MKEPLISVIVPVYNTAEYLPCCLESLMNQTYPHLEIICINDGSTDNSGNILERYAVCDKRIVVVHQENQGQAKARNVGLSLAHGDYVTGLDSDDYLAPDAYKKAIAAIPEDCDFLLFETTVFGDAPEELRRQNQGYYSLSFCGEQEITTELAKHTDASFWDKLIRRSLIEQYHIRFPEGYIFEDACFYFCLMGVATRAYYLKERLHFYRLRAVSTMSHAYNSTPKALHHLQIMDALSAFYSKHGLATKKPLLFGYAFDYCCGFAERNCPANMQELVTDIEKRMAHEYGFGVGMPHLWVVQKLRRLSLSPLHRLFHTCFKNQDRFGPCGFPLISVIHNETEDIYRLLTFCLFRKKAVRYLNFPAPGVQRSIA